MIQHKTPTDESLSGSFLSLNPLPHVEQMRSAVFGNVGSLIYFRVGNSDAKVLQLEFGKSYAQETFVGLDRFQVIARLSEDGQTREAVRAQTLPPIEHQVGRREKLIARSREKYAAKRADVEAKIERWVAGHDSDPRRIRKGRIPFLPIASLLL